MLLSKLPIIWIIIVSFLTYFPTILPSLMGMETQGHVSCFLHLSSPSPLLKNYSCGKLKRKQNEPQNHKSLALRRFAIFITINNVLPADSRAEDARGCLCPSNSSPPTRGEGAEAIKRKWHWEGRGLILILKRLLAYLLEVWQTPPERRHIIEKNRKRWGV